jgi:hypothetical protein
MSNNVTKKLYCLTAQHASKCLLEQSDCTVLHVLGEQKMKLSGGQWHKGETHILSLRNSAEII